MASWQRLRWSKKLRLNLLPVTRLWQQRPRHVHERLSHQLRVPGFLFLVLALVQNPCFLDLCYLSLTLVWTRDLVQRYLLLRRSGRDQQTD